jgi:hypothetical protein
MTQFRLTYTIDREHIETGIFAVDGDDFAAVWEKAWEILESTLDSADLLRVQAVNILILSEPVTQ